MKPIAGLAMGRIGRFQLRLRIYLLLPAIVAVSWWLANQAVEANLRREIFQERVEQHDELASHFQQLAQSKTPDYVEVYLIDTKGRCTTLFRPIGAEVLEKERSARRSARGISSRDETELRLGGPLPLVLVAKDPPEP